jgi:CheY-like chemotaxis protein
MTECNSPSGDSSRGNATMTERDQGSHEPMELRVPLVVLVDADSALCSTLHRTLGAACQTLCVEPQGAVALLQGLDVVDVALVDCDQPPSVQAPIFHELARWPQAVCVLMSANMQKVEQFRALGIFAPLVLDKPVQQDALEALRSATLELALQGLDASLLGFDASGPIEADTLDESPKLSESAKIVVEASEPHR